MGGQAMRFMVIVVLIGLAALAATPAAAQTMRLELYPVQTVTLTGEQFLTGAKDGKPATVSGELRIPRLGTDRLPAVVLVHGSGGVSGYVDDWSQQLNSIGVATFILDSFTGRGLVSTVNDQDQL